MRSAQVSLSVGEKRILSASLVEAGEISCHEDGSLLAKEQELRRLIRNLGSVIVAYSGGVDSSYVAYVANDELGDQALCITGVSPSVSAFQRNESESIARQFRFRHEVIETNELEDNRYLANDSSRCYFCKTELYGKLRVIAQSQNIPWILDGSTTDDVGDYRPGRAAAEERGVISPLVEAGLSKDEIRRLSREVGLPTWDKPASPCLSSRIAYGVSVTEERLTAVEQGEEILREMGFREFRVRHHDSLVRLEIARDELERVMSLEVFEELSKHFRGLGFKYVTLDLEGFRSGAMNEVLVQLKR